MAEIEKSERIEIHPEHLRKLIVEGPCLVARGWAHHVSAPKMSLPSTMPAWEVCAYCDAARLLHEYAVRS